jgi:hypothetical protein
LAISYWQLQQPITNNKINIEEHVIDVWDYRLRGGTAGGYDRSQQS